MNDKQFYRSASGRQGEKEKFRGGDPERIGNVLPEVLPKGPRHPHKGPPAAGQVRRPHGLAGRWCPVWTCHPKLYAIDAMGLAVIHGRDAHGRYAGIVGGASRLADLLGGPERQWRKRAAVWRRLGLVRLERVPGGCRWRLVRTEGVPAEFWTAAHERYLVLGIGGHNPAGPETQQRWQRLGYCWLPVGLLCEKTLSLRDRAVWAYLYKRAWQFADGRAFVHERKVAACLRMARPVVERALAELEAAGVIEAVGQTGRGRRAWAVREALGGSWIKGPPVAGEGLPGDAKAVESRGQGRASQRPRESQSIKHTP